MLSEARVRMNQSYYDQNGVTAEGEVAETVNLEKLNVKPKAPLTEVFKDIKPIEECTIEKTKGRLKHDEKVICEKLVKKHGPENYVKMAKDIKTNYLQWSRGQCQKYVKLFLETNQ